MRFIPSVYIEVVLQSGLLQKCLVTQWASEILDPSVDMDRSGQVTLQREAFLTQLTQVLPVFLQVAHIALQVLEDFVTPLTQKSPLDQYAACIFCQLISSKMTL